MKIKKEIKIEKCPYCGKEMKFIKKGSSDSTRISMSWVDSVYKCENCDKTIYIPKDRDL